MKRAGPTVRQFKEMFRKEMESRGRHVGLWRDGHVESEHIVEVDTTPTTVLYVKERNADRGWWGLTESFLGDLETSRVTWGAVLLLGLPTEGYLLPSRFVLDHLGGGKWTLARDGDYKINEPRDVDSQYRFRSAADFIDQFDRLGSAV